MKHFIIFAFGGISYGLIELLFRHVTHWTMVLAGGICFLIIGFIGNRLKMPFIFKAVCCAVCISAVEFIFGLIFNVLFQQNIWDYSHLPLNLLGQICLLFSVLWIFLSLFALKMNMILYDNLSKKTSVMQKRNSQKQNFDSQATKAREA